MRVGLMGFGKTGKAVASVLLSSKETHLCWVLRKSRKLDHRSVPEFLGVDSDEPGLILSSEDFTAARLLDEFPVDVIVDFSSQDGIEYYAEEAMRRGITVISAVSAYPDAQRKLLHSVARTSRVVHSPNITVGVNFLLIAAKILRNIAPETDVEIIEEHFKSKPETSGTAKIIAGHLGVPEREIKTVRAGGIIGTHEILFGFPYQTVRLKHESIARDAFGNGILFALRALPDTSAGLFTMEDLMAPYFKLHDSEELLSQYDQLPRCRVW